MQTDKYVEREAAFITDYLTTLVDAKVVRIAAVTDDSDDWMLPDVWPVLVFEKPDGTLLQVDVSRDPEGNGPGHLFITDITDKS